MDEGCRNTQTVYFIQTHGHNSVICLLDEMEHGTYPNIFHKISELSISMIKTIDY